MKLFEVVASVLDVDADLLTDESNAQNTERWDSLRHIEVIMAVENRFHVRFSMPEISGLQKLGDIRDLLIQKGALAEDHVEDDVRQTA